MTEKEINEKKDFRREVTPEYRENDAMASSQEYGLRKHGLRRCDCGCARSGRTGTTVAIVVLAACLAISIGFNVYFAIKYYGGGSFGEPANLRTIRPGMRKKSDNPLDSMGPDTDRDSGSTESDTDRGSDSTRSDTD